MVRVQRDVGRLGAVALSAGAVAELFGVELIVGRALVQRVTRQARQLLVAAAALVAGRAQKAVVLAPAHANRAVAIKQAIGAGGELRRVGLGQNFGAQQKLRLLEIAAGRV